MLVLPIGHIGPVSRSFYKFMSRTKHWVFTLNNYTREDEERIQALDCVYVVYGREVGSEGGTPHLQGYVSLSTRKRLAGVKSLIGNRIHAEPRRGTHQEASDYCKKDGDFFEKGEEPPKQGKRTDLIEVKEFIDGGAGELAVAEKYFDTWVKYSRALSAYAALRTPPKMRPDLKVFCLYGDPGCGKTRYVYDRYPDVFSVPDHKLQWFDGYSQEKVVLLDDYRGDGDSALLLRLLDIYPMRS